MIVQRLNMRSPRSLDASFLLEFLGEWERCDCLKATFFELANGVGYCMVVASFCHVKQLTVVANLATMGHAVAARLQLDEPDAFT